MNCPRCFHQQEYTASATFFCGHCGYTSGGHLHDGSPTVTPCGNCAALETAIAKKDAQITELKAMLSKWEIDIAQIYQLVAAGGSGVQYDSSWMRGKPLMRKEREEEIIQALRIMEALRGEK